MNHLVLTAMLDDHEVWIRVTDLTEFVMADKDSEVFAELSDGRAFRVRKGDLTQLQVEQSYSLSR